MIQGPAKIFTGDVRRQRDHSLSIDAIVFTDDRGVLDPREVAKQRLRRAFAGHWHDAQIIQGLHLRLWHLHLHLERDPRSRIGPVVGRDETARRGCRRERTSNFVDCDTELTRHLAIDVDLNRGIVEGLPVLQVAQRRDAGELVAELASERPGGGEIRTHHCNLHGSRCTEVHDAADDVAGLE